MGPLIRIAVACLLAAVLVGCSGRTSLQSGGAVGPATPTVPPILNLATPEEAVRSYLAWVSLANRMANSEAATRTHTEAEGVRVDAYIQLNREQGQGLEQHLTDFVVTSVSTDDSTATVVTSEDWRFRYFSLGTIQYIGPEELESYVVTYTVVHRPDGRWLVDSVEATTSPSRGN